MKGIATLRHLGASTPNRAHPWHPNDAAGGLTVPEDSALFGYDALGNMIWADNSAAQVRRTYHLNGSIHTDWLHTGTWTASGRSSSLSEHAYGLTYSYDLNGRVTSVEHPWQLAPSAAQNRTSYSYDRLTGALATVRDVLGNTFTYGYQADGALESLAMPAGSTISERYQYDLDGRRTRHDVFNNSTAPIRYTGAIRAESFEYDQRGKLLESRSTAGARDTLSARYSGLGHLVWSRSASHGRHGFHANYTLSSATRESFQYDALGNTVSTTNVDTVRNDQTGEYQTNGLLKGGNYYYHPNTGRLNYQMTGSDPEYTHYDASGNVVYSRTGTTSNPLQDRVSYYGATGCCGRRRSAGSRAAGR